MKFRLYFILMVLIAVFTFTRCLDTDPDGSLFDNKVYIDAGSKTITLLVKDETEASKTFHAALAKPAESTIKLLFEEDKSLVSTYNSAYYDQAYMLPAKYYEISAKEAIIPEGSAVSTDITVHFKSIDNLSRDTVYVLPVTIANADKMDILKSGRTLYFVLKAGALINVVADIHENYLAVNWTNPDVCNNLSQVTMEALIRARTFNKLISTVMGIEGKFLIRIGDSGYDPNQIQIATSNGNFPGATSDKGLPVNEWVHIALTYDALTYEYNIYVNGKVQSTGIHRNIGLINLGVGGTNGFFIGRSYDNNRSLDGEISECRIWNIIRTKDEIANSPYFVVPDAEGLVAYWKFDEGSGNTVKDQTGNGNNAVANSNLKWTSVELPEK
ncbi:DUF1735 and LamG domain-containing protein [Gaoshiqia sp. Z1-71]|uniref:DUF1735 and LamG domain-containing protein n=1 Tax=Gaoshiqia hydrogeniformans TaxID=3290090 RepID=UPI003BF8C5BE